MAHFYGTLQGHQGQASRLGTAKTGLRVVAASWQGAVDVHLYERNGVDMASVTLKPWNGVGLSREIYNGPVAGKKRWQTAQTRAEQRRRAEWEAREQARLADPPVTTTEDDGAADALVPDTVEVEDPTRWAEYNRKFNALLMGGAK